MSVTDQNLRFGSRSLPDPMGGVAVEILRRVAEAIRRIAVARRERRAIATLTSLDDRILADIGVARSGIRHIARTVAEDPQIDYRIIHRF